MSQSQLKSNNSPSKLKKLAGWWVFKLFFVGLILSFSIVSSAKVSDEFQAQLVKKIFADCANQNIVIRNDCEDTNKISTIPSDIDQLRKYVASLNETSFEVYWVGGYLGGRGACKGRALIKCGSHVLDVSGNDYIWDGVVFSIPPTNISNTAINNSGNLIQGAPGANIQGGNRISGNNNRITEKSKIDLKSNQNLNVTVYLRQINSLNDQVTKLSKKTKLLEISIAICVSVFSACLVFLFVTPHASKKRRIQHAVLMLLAGIALSLIVFL